MGALSVRTAPGAARALLGSTSLTGLTVTTSQPLLNLTQTWNAAGVTFTALNLNVTNTASAAASNLQAWQVGGSTVARIDRSGGLYVAERIQFTDGAQNLQFNGRGYFNMSSDGVFQFRNNATSNGVTMAVGANNLATFNGPVRTLTTTVAALPAAGTAGRRAFVTDALTPTFGAAVTGGGAVAVPVYDTGAAWFVG